MAPDDAQLRSIEAVVRKFLAAYHPQGRRGSTQLSASRSLWREVSSLTLLQLVAGIFQSFSRSPRQLAIDTPYMNATIEGTEFVLEVGADRSSITVLEGVETLSDVERDQAHYQMRVLGAGAK